MDIVEQREQWAAEFEREYPEELPDRLRWFTERLGIQPYHLLRLMGLSRPEAEALAKGPLDWDAVIARYSEESAWWAEGTVMNLLSYYHFDWHALRERLHQPPDRSMRIYRPGGWAVSPDELPREERESILLTLIAEGGPRSSAAALAYLLHPAGPAARP
jgi:hypothetical protein